MSQITEIPDGFVISENGLVDTNYKYPLVQYSKEPITVNARVHEMVQWFTDHLEVSPRKYFSLSSLRVQYKNITQQHGVSLGEVLFAMREAGFTQMRIYKGSPIVDFRVKWKDTVKEQWERDEAKKRQPVLPCIACPICSLTIQKKQLKNHYKFKHANEALPDMAQIPEIVKGTSLSPTEPTVKSQEDEVAPIHLTIEEIAPAQPEEPVTDPVPCKTCEAINEHISEYVHSHDSVVETVESFCGEYERAVADNKQLQMKETLSRCDIDTLRKEKAKLEDALESTATRLRMFEMLVDELSDRYNLEKQIGIIWSMLK